MPLDATQLGGDERVLDAGLARLDTDRLAEEVFLLGSRQGRVGIGRPSLCPNFGPVISDREFSIEISACFGERGTDVL